MLPSIFGENLFDEFFDDSFGMFPVWNDRNPLYGKHSKNLMKTDVRETENTYEVDIDLPGFKKDEIKIECNKGNLVISAEKCEKDDEEDNERNYLRRERVYNKYSRSFYLGDVAEEEISAKFSDGTLTVVVPKKQEVETKKYIDIE